MKALFPLFLIPLALQAQTPSEVKAKTAIDSTSGKSSLPAGKSREEVLERIEFYRQEVISGKKTMQVVARLYSEDPGSAKDGGFIPNVARGVMDPEFEAVAFRLKSGEISPVFESKYGFHFIQLISREGELLHLRHVLLTFN